MKSLFKYIPVLALAIAATSCDDLIDDKAVIDGKYSVDLPTVTLSELKVLDYSTIEVAYSISSLDCVAAAGVQVATDAQFSAPDYFAFEEPATQGTATVTGLAPDTKYYGRLFFSTNDGTTFSEAKEFTTPSVPLTSALLVGKSYKGSVVSYFDRESNFNVSFSAVEGDDYKVIVENLDPYFAENGFTADKGVNVFEGTIDPETGILTIYANQKLGYKDVVIMGFDNADPDAAENYDHIYVQINNFGASITFLNAWGVAGWYTLYYGNLTLKP